MLVSPPSSLESKGAALDETFPLPGWDEESHLAFMDSAGIVTAVLSMPAPQPYFGDIEETKPVIRESLRLFGKSAADADRSPVRQVAKLPMQADGIVRLSRVEVRPEYLDEYLEMAAEVGQTSLLTEPGVLTMYALSEKEHPNVITILETYASQEAYRSHIASAHFQKYKQGTLHMVKDLRLLDQTELTPANHIINFIK